MTLKSVDQSQSNDVSGASARPLEGMRVIDLTDHRGDIGPWILGELGADVIKVEPPEGCATRHANPLKKNDSSDLGSLHFGAYASNKRSIALDLDELSLIHI